MKLTPNNFFLISLLMVCFSATAKQGPPPPPAGPPLPPGFTLDDNLFLMVVFGVIFSFIFLKKYSSFNKKA
tara:strand:- start:34575 stop:34787 length:213 start_codon:yes stop_codon:yes gene_type:complete